MRRVRPGDEVRVLVRDHHLGSDELVTALVLGVVHEVTADHLVLDWWSTVEGSDSPRKPGDNCEAVCLVRSSVVEVVEVGTGDELRV